jgi:ABC-2 type transport system permease protein
MLSQAIESVTRVFYARADLDLIMSSPAPLTNLFSVRIAAIALTVTVMALLLATPFIDVLVIGGGARWFSAYRRRHRHGPVGVGVSPSPSLSDCFSSAALPRRGWSRRSFRRSRRRLRHRAAGRGDSLLRHAVAFRRPDLRCRSRLCAGGDSMVWWPARAMLGDIAALLPLLAAGLMLLGSAMAIFSPRFSTASPVPPPLAQVRRKKAQDARSAGIAA